MIPLPKQDYVLCSKLKSPLLKNLDSLLTLFINIDGHTVMKCFSQSGDPSFWRLQYIFF